VLFGNGTKDVRNTIVVVVVQLGLAPSVSLSGLWRSKPSAFAAKGNVVVVVNDDEVERIIDFMGMAVYVFVFRKALCEPFAE